MGIVVFDMDGTLVRNDRVAVGAALDGLADYFAERGEPAVLPPAETIRALVGLPALEYFAGLLPPERRGDARAVMAHVGRREVDRLASGQGRRLPAAERVLEALRGGGHRIVLVSNCLRPYFDGNLDHVLRRSWFDVAYCLDDHPTKTENVTRAVERLGGGAGVVVGDRGSDLEAGRAAGLRTVGCRYGYGTREELAGADRVVDDLSEVPDAVTALLSAGGGAGGPGERPAAPPRRS